MITEDSSDRFWYVTYHGERSRKVLQADEDQRCLRDELVGVPLAKTWRPPGYRIIGTGVWPEWMAYWVPLLSSRALPLLRDLLAPHCEFLPWIDEPEHRYTLINVTTQIPRANWSCKTSSVYGDVYAAADVIELHDVAVPAIFRLEGYRGKIFVSDTVARTSVDNSLKGAIFVDPLVPEVNLSFIRMRFGRRGTGFVRKEDDLPGDLSAVH